MSNIARIISWFCQRAARDNNTNPCAEFQWPGLNEEYDRMPITVKSRGDGFDGNDVFVVLVTSVQIVTAATFVRLHSASATAAPATAQKSLSKINSRITNQPSVIVRHQRGTRAMEPRAINTRDIINDSTPRGVASWGRCDKPIF